MSSGSTTFFLDFDIFSIAPISIGSPVSTCTARRFSASLSIRTSAGKTNWPAASR